MDLDNTMEQQNTCGQWRFEHAMLHPHTSTTTSPKMYYKHCNKLSLLYAQLMRLQCGKILLPSIGPASERHNFIEDGPYNMPCTTMLSLYAGNSAIQH